MDRKRARFADNPWRSAYAFEEAGHEGSSVAPADTAAQRSIAGRRLRFWLFEKHLRGQLSAPDVTAIAYLHTKAGGVGLEDVGLPLDSKASHAHHLKLILKRDFSPPDDYVVKVPIHNKSSCRRQEGYIATKLPSVLLHRHAHTFSETESYP